MLGAQRNGARWSSLLGAFVAWNALLFVRTPVPAEDGVSYLWMAERFAAQDWQAGLSTVFPPGWPLLLAPWLALGMAPEWVSFVVATACGLLALVPVARLAEALRPGAGWSAAVLFAASPLLGRLCVEGYSEPAFLLPMAWGTWFGLRGRTVAMGLCSAAAFWVRPEGALLAPAMALAAPTMRAAFGRGASAGALVLLGVALLGLLRMAAGFGFDPLPIHAFHETRHELAGRGDVLANALAVPGPWFEAFGVSGLLALVAIGGGLWPLRAGVLLQIGVVLTFVVRRRFFVSAAVAVHALAALALARLPSWLRTGLLALAVLHALWAGFFGGIDADRAVERQLGSYLHTQLRADDVVVSEAVRVVYFAGLQPPEPRRENWLQLLSRAEATRAVGLVLTRKTADAADAERLAAAFAPWPLPDELASACERRGLVVFARR